jgi:uncharacterized membrane protein YphA (DoxX/SURF4 family)
MPTTRTMAAVLAGLRIYLGVVFLVAVLPKLTEPGFTGRMVGFLENVAVNHGHEFFRGFVTSTVIPNAGTFAALVATAELVVAVLLLAGAATRAAAAIAAFLLLNYMFAKGSWFWTPSSNDAALFMIALATLIVGSGRTFGVDRWLAERWPRVPLW